jgi:hypothetical protein
MAGNVHGVLDIGLGGALQLLMSGLEIVADVEMLTTHETNPGAAFAKRHKVRDVSRSNVVGAEGHVESYSI